MMNNTLNKLNPYSLRSCSKRISPLSAPAFLKCIGMLLLLMVAGIPKSLAQNFLWAKSMGGISNDIGLDIAMDGSGQATFTKSNWSEGSQLVTANYSGTTGFSTSSVTLTQLVNNMTTVNASTFCNTGSITFNDGGTGGYTGTAATPYPSNMVVSGLFGTIQSITVDLKGVVHTKSRDIDLLLVAPTGQKFLMMTGVGSGIYDGFTNPDFIPIPSNLTLSDAAGSALPRSIQISSGTYRPTSYEWWANTFPSPAPAPTPLPTDPYTQPAPVGTATFASVFNGLNPNGSWELFATDDTSGVTGSIANGWCLNFTISCTNPIAYVNAAVVSSGDGTTWATAFKTLQEALTAANACPSITQIWVAAGTYKPTSGTDRNISFVMKNGVAIYGGFIGNETLLSERNWGANVTMLSGEIGSAGNSDNSYHVIFNNNNGLNSTAVLDGFTITAGNANGSFPNSVGGGMYNSASSPTVTNCTFSGNTANSFGGGMYNNSSSSPTVTNSTFSGNTATNNNGGGMFNFNSSPTVTNSTFSGNTARFGGGMGNTSSSSPMVTNSTFSVNAANNNGGGMFNFESSPTVSNCTFSGNTASLGGGMGNTSSSPVVTNNTFSGNRASNEGGGMFNLNSSPAVSNCTFSGNTANSFGGGMSNQSNSSPQVTNSSFLENTATNIDGGGMYNFDSSSPAVTNSTFSGNTARVGGGMYNLRNSSPVVTNSTFSGNTATIVGGGMGNADSSSPVVTNSTFSGNTAGFAGGMYNTSSSSPTITNSTFSGNTATNDGGGMYNQINSSPTVTNTTFSGNTAGSFGGGMVNSTSSPTVTNSIIFNNTAGGSSTSASASVYNESSNPSFSHSLIANSGGSGSWVSAIGTDGGNNIAADPLFVAPLAPGLSTGGNYRLQACSPAIDAGTSTGAPTTDILGNARVDAIAGGNTVDMGAYEYQSTLPEINLQGGSPLTDIPDGDNTPTVAKRTDLGNVFIGGTVTVAGVIIQNTGTIPLSISAITASGGDAGMFTPYLSDLTIPAGGSRSFQISFAPTSAGLKSTTIHISNSDCDEADYDFVVQATGICEVLTINAPTVTQPTCAMPTGTIVVNATGSGTLEYSINNGSTWQSSNTYGGQAPGNYNIKVRLQATPSCEATYASNPVVLNSPPLTTWYADIDGDSFGDPANMTMACSVPMGYVTNNTDCNDQNALEKPGQLWYKDNDNDNYGQTGAASISQCFRPVGYKAAVELTSTTGDCNDNNNAINPAATEICDGIDNDCDGMTDEGVTTRYYYDFDGDGYGENGAYQDRCSPSGFYNTTLNGDCNNSDNSVYPNAPEVCDGKDNDCDGMTDEGVTTRYYYDFDGDGYGENGAYQDRCSPSGFYNTTLNGDCNNSDNSVYPNAPEVCDGKDNDCDGMTDEGVTTRYYYDFDGDGYGENGAYQDRCSPSGFYNTTLNGDCNNSDNSVYPNAPELCDGKDNDCDGMTDEIYFLPCGWSAEPNGVGCNAGSSVAYNFNTQRFTATSTNCYYPNSFTSDALAFAQYDLCGNGSITAQVTSITGGLGWAGVTMRESNAAGAKKAQLMTNLSNFSRREFRTTTGGAAYPQQFPSQNRYWLRITRTGNQFVMYISPNGTAWSFAGVQNISMNSCIEVGLVVTNYTANSTVTATFANVSVTGGMFTKPAINTQEAVLAVADFTIQPNPTNGWIEIDLSSYGQRKVQLDMYNLQGKLLRSTKIEISKGKEEIDLTALGGGMYLIRVRAEGLQDVTKRVVKIE